MEISKEKLNKLKDFLKDSKCSKHKDYNFEYFCQIRSCSHGILCSACEELEHEILHHHEYTQNENPNLVEFPEFCENLFKFGLYYEEGDDLKIFFTDQNLKSIRKERTRQKELKLKQAKSTRRFVEEKIEDLVKAFKLKLEATMKRLVERVEKVYDDNVSFLTNILEHASEIKKKREHAFKLVLGDLDRAMHKDDLDTRKISISVQTFLDSSFSVGDVRVISGIKEIVKHLDSEKILPKFDLEFLEKDFKSLKLEVVNSFQVVTNRFFGDAELQLDEYIKNLSKFSEPHHLDLDLDARVTVLSDDHVSSLEVLDKDMIAIGTIKGFIKLYEYSSLVYETAVRKKRDEEANGEGVYPQTIPMPVYESNTLFHDSTIKHLTSYDRSSDKIKVLISSDRKGCIVLSRYIKSDKRLERLQKFMSCHYSQIKTIVPISKSNFFFSFSQGEPLKIWNGHEGFLSIKLNEGNSCYDLTCAIMGGFKELAIGNAEGVIRLFSLDFTNYTKNINIYKLGLESKITEMGNIAYFEIESANNSEIPYLAALLHDYQNLEFRVMNDKSLELLKIYRINFANLSKDYSLINAMLKIYFTKSSKRMAKFNENAFVDTLRVYCYQLEARGMSQIGFREGDIKVERFIGMVGNIDEEFVLKRCDDNKGNFFTVDDSLKTIFIHKFKP